MSVWQYIIGAAIILVCAALVFLVLMQESRSAGLSGAIAGGADTFFSKNKARSIDAFLARWTKFFAIGFIICVVALNAIARFI